MRIGELQIELDRINRIGNEKWLGSLDARKRAELEFHNRDRDPKFRKEAATDSDTYEKFYGNKKYYTATRQSQEYTERWIQRHAPGNVFLDYACGNGVNAIRAAGSGAALSIGLDISDVSVANARDAAANAGVSGNTRFVQADCENTQLPNDAIDTVVCSGMLHHLDLSFAFPELRRILAPGGRILCIEALDYNPIIKFYRLMTPEMRTKWERAHILSMRDVEFARRFFTIGEVKFWHITSYAAGKLPFLLVPLEALDRILGRIPLVRLMAWIFTFELIKAGSSETDERQATEVRVR
jgi:ubiquinone/menaquinone biosynthesis C-methylase UbiE